MLCTNVFALSAAERKAQVGSSDAGRSKPGVVLTQCNISSLRAPWNPDNSCWTKSLLTGNFHPFPKTRFFFILDIVFSLCFSLWCLSWHQCGYYLKNWVGTSDDAEVKVCFGGWIQSLELRTEIIFLGTVCLGNIWQVKNYHRWLIDLVQCRLTLWNSYE